MAANLDKKIVFLVRGDLIRRYPGVVAHAVRQAQIGVPPTPQIDPTTKVPLLESGNEHTPKETLFHIVLPPNILLAGFEGFARPLDRAKPPRASGCPGMERVGSCPQGCRTAGIVHDSATSPRPGDTDVLV